MRKWWWNMSQGVHFYSFRLKLSINFVFWVYFFEKEVYAMSIGTCMRFWQSQLNWLLEEWSLLVVLEFFDSFVFHASTCSLGGMSVVIHVIFQHMVFWIECSWKLYSYSTAARISWRVITRSDSRVDNFFSRLSHDSVCGSCNNEYLSWSP